jgi:hypothetical protein
MPFKSQAQRRKFAELLVEGKISADTFEEWNRETGSKKLPEHVASSGRKKRAARKRVAVKSGAKRSSRKKR